MHDSGIYLSRKPPSYFHVVTFRKQHAHEPRYCPQKLPVLWRTSLSFVARVIICTTYQQNPDFRDCFLVVRSQHSDLWWICAKLTLRILKFYLVSFLFGETFVRNSTYEADIKQNEMKQLFLEVICVSLGMCVKTCWSFPADPAAGH